MSISLSPQDWLDFFVHFASLSLLGIGGAITTAPDMHRYLVDERNWLTDATFSSSIALAQSAPGPNVLFVAVLGWNVGMASGGGPANGPLPWALASAAMAVSMVGIIIPSTTLTFFAARWGQRNRERAEVRAFKQSMAPVVIALLVATGWLLTASHGNVQQAPLLWLLTVVSALLVWKTRIHLLWLIGAGALAGVLGLV
jgi:chromate transporter